MKKRFCLLSVLLVLFVLLFAVAACDFGGRDPVDSDPGGETEQGGSGNKDPEDKDPEDKDPEGGGSEGGDSEGGGSEGGESEDKDPEDGKLQLNESSLTIYVGGSGFIEVVSDDLDDMETFTWESSDPDIVKAVEGPFGGWYCYPYGLAKGTATLTVTSGSGRTGSCTVTVKDLKVELSETNLTIYRRADNTYESKTLTATVKHDGEPTSDHVTWKSSDESVVTVEGGVLTAHALGSATITATVVGSSAKASCEVNVVWENGAVPEGWYPIRKTGSNGALETPGQWTWSGFEGPDDVHADLSGEGIGESGDIVFSVVYNMGWRWYGTQLFFKHPVDGALVAGTAYKLTFKLESTNDGAITVNDTDVEVKTGTQTVEVIYRETGVDSVSVTITLATHDKIRNSVNPIGQYREGTISISDMKWEVYEVQELHAPTAFTVKDDGELLITDDNNDDTFEGYVIGFFKEGAEEPSYTQPIMKPVRDRDILDDRGGVPDVVGSGGARPQNAGKMYLDDSFVENGEYTLKVKAYCGTALYAASPWSTATVSHTVAHENGVEYKVLQSYRDVDRGVGRYYVWAEWNQIDLEKCSFKDNSLTLTLTGEASWFSNQVYCDISGLEVNHLYECRFTFGYDPTASGGTLEGRQFIVNGQRIDVSSEAHHTYTIYFLYTGGPAVMMLLGRPTADWQGTVENGGLPQGTYTFSDITLRDVTEETPGEESGAVSADRSEDRIAEKRRED